MDNREILKIAMEQSARDLNCDANDFVKAENVYAVSVLRDDARRYLKLPFFCQMASYGNNVVASGDPAFLPEIKKYLDKFTWYHCFETPNLHVLDQLLAPHGHKVCFMAEYFLPDADALRELPCAYLLKVLEPRDFAGLYLPQWSNALCEKRKHLDALAVGAYDGEKLIALAGASADCDTMWQIGIDVLPQYRRQGVASALTARLAIEVLKKGKVPFYCCAWSNIPSARNAVRAGFRPAWVEMTARPCAFVDEMNGKN